MTLNVLWICSIRYIWIGSKFDIGLGVHNCIFHSVAAMKLEPCLLSTHTPPTNPFTSFIEYLQMIFCKWFRPGLHIFWANAFCGQMHDELYNIQTCQSTHIAGHIYFLFLVAKCKWTLMSNRYSLDCITITPVPNLVFFPSSILMFL